MFYSFVFFLAQTARRYDSDSKIFVFVDGINLVKNRQDNVNVGMESARDDGGGGNGGSSPTGGIRFNIYNIIARGHACMVCVYVSVKTLFVCSLIMSTWSSDKSKSKWNKKKKKTLNKLYSS